VPGAQQANVITNPALFGKAGPTTPAALAFNTSDISIYETTGFRVSLAAKGDGGADAGASTTVFDESLARIQKLSSPRDVPDSYYSVASNYALLLLGDPDAKLPDGGADNDERRTIHFLAVPVISPKAADGGTEGGAAEDGGAASTP
jgi:hypothetical protein